MKRLILFATINSILFSLFAQEALKSTEEEYYDFLSLQDIVERPTLGYRTLSDSEWNFALDEDGNSLSDSDGNIWKNNNLGKKHTLWQSESSGENWFTRGFDHSLTLKIYGPEWYNSYNTAAPYGQNDGALWQGKGYNTSLTGGARLEGYGFEVTVKPQVSFSQNLEFDYITPNYSGSNYEDKAALYGYYGVSSIDAPQRFGDSAFGTFDWGDTEIRWNWRTFTTGFGTQAIWLGPAQLNPILHSNNAASYPKFDIGLRKTALYMPHFGWYLGAIEMRGWMGYLSESDYFDNDDSNDHNRINGFTVSYELPFPKGLSIGLAKVCLTKWGAFEIKYLNPFYDQNGGVGTTIGEDQKMSFFADWIISTGGIEIYGEAGIDDYLQGGWFTGLIRYPFDSLVWTLGLKKSFCMYAAKKIYGEIVLEFSDMEEPRNKISANQSYFFNSHYQITQGYTNSGQYLGSALANGGNAQTLIYNVYYPKGKTSLLLQRSNPDDTYSYANLDNENQTYKGYGLIGLSNTYFILPELQCTIALTYQRIINSLYFNTSNTSQGTALLHNVCLTFGCIYNF